MKTLTYKAAYQCKSLLMAAVTLAFVLESITWSAVLPSAMIWFTWQGNIYHVCVNSAELLSPACIKLKTSFSSPCDFIQDMWLELHRGFHPQAVLKRAASTINVTRATLFLLRGPYVMCRGSVVWPVYADVGTTPVACTHRHCQSKYTTLLHVT
jgi:hypothetical protein